MARVAELLVGPHVYTIYEGTEKEVIDHPHWRDDAPDPDEVIGLHNGTFNRIFLITGDVQGRPFSASKRREVLLHEVLHACCGCFLTPGAILKEEAIVNPLAWLLQEAAARNPWLVPAVFSTDAPASGYLLPDSTSTQEAV